MICILLVHFIDIFLLQKQITFAFRCPGISRGTVESFQRCGEGYQVSVDEQRQSTEEGSTIEFESEQVFRFRHDELASPRPSEQVENRLEDVEREEQEAAG